MADKHEVVATLAHESEAAADVHGTIRGNSTIQRGRQLSMRPDFFSSSPDTAFIVEKEAP